MPSRSRYSGQKTIWELLNERAFRPKFEKGQLLLEQLAPRTAPPRKAVSAHRHEVVCIAVAKQTAGAGHHVAESDELQRLVRLIARRAEWFPEGNRKIQLFALPANNRKPADLKSLRAGVSYYHALRYRVGDSNP